MPFITVDPKHPLSTFATQEIENNIIRSEAIRYIIIALEQKIPTSFAPEISIEMDTPSLFDQVKAIRLPFYFTELSENARRNVDEQAVEMIAEIVDKDMAEDKSIKQLFTTIKRYRCEYLKLLKDTSTLYAKSIREAVINDEYSAPKIYNEAEYARYRQACRCKLHLHCWDRKYDELKSSIHEYMTEWVNEKTKLFGLIKPTAKDRQEFFAELLGEQDENGLTLFHIAAILGDVDLFNYLNSLSPGYDVSDEHESLPQHYAAKHGHTTFVNNCITSAPHLLNAIDGNGRTILHYAAFNGQLDLVVSLLEKNAALETSTVDGKISEFELNDKKGKIEVTDQASNVSVLHSAVTNNQAAAVLLLLEKGANATYKQAERTQSETTGLAWAISRGNNSIIQLLYPHASSVSYVFLRNEFLDSLAFQAANETFILIAREICISSFYHALITTKPTETDENCHQIYVELSAFCHALDENVEAKLHQANPKKYKEKEHTLKQIIANQTKIIEEKSAELEEKDKALDEERSRRTEAQKYNEVMQEQLNAAKDTGKSKTKTKNKKENKLVTEPSDKLSRSDALIAAKKCIDNNDSQGLQDILNTQAMIDIKDENGDTLLHYAVNSRRPTLKIILILDENQIAITAHNTAGEPAVFSAIKNSHDDIAFHLLKNEHRIKNSTDKNDNTVLHIAAAAGRQAIVTHLLQQQNHAVHLISQTNKLGQTALFAAVSATKNKTFKILLKSLSIDIKDNEGNNIAHAAARVGDIHALRKISKRHPELLLQSNSIGDAPIHTAVSHNQHQALALLARHYKDLSTAVNKQRQNLLQLSIMKPNLSDVFDYLIKHDDVVQLVSHRDAYGKSSLHSACSMDNSRALLTLITTPKLKVNVNETDSTGQTCLHEAVLSESDNCLEILLKNGANVYLQDNSENNVVSLARQLIIRRRSQSLEKRLAIINRYKQQDAIKQIAELTRKDLKIKKQNATALNKGATKDLLIEKVIHALESLQPFKIYIAALDNEAKFNTVVDEIANSIKKCAYEFSKNETTKFYLQFEKNHNSADLLLKIRELVIQALERAHAKNPSFSEIEPAVTFKQDKVPLNITVFRDRLTTILHKTVGAMEKLASAEYVDQTNQINLARATTAANVASAGIGAASGVIASAANTIIPVAGVGQAIETAIPMAQTLIQVGVPAIVEWLNERDVKQKQAAANRILQVLTKRTIGEANINFAEVDKVINLMEKRFCEFLLSEDTSVDAATLLANCIGERILVHLAKENTDTVKGRKNAIVRAGINFIELIRTTTNNNYTPDQEEILTLPERSLHAILEERTSDSHKAGLYRITYKDVDIEIKDIVERSGLKVWQPSQSKFLYYSLNEKKSQHQLFGFCQTTETEPEKRKFSELPYYEPQGQSSSNALIREKIAGANNATNNRGFFNNGSATATTAQSSSSSSSLVTMNRSDS